MSSLIFKAVAAGILFGIWPLFMSRSGLNGFVSAAAFSTLTLLVILPFALYQNGGWMLPTANWGLVIAAGVLAGIALLFFNSMLSQAMPHNVGTLFVICLLAQIVAPAIYQSAMSGGITLSQLGGYAAAGLSAYLLLR